jgi:ABC-type uncharacterized transport system auxiliary subunit
MQRFSVEHGHHQRAILSSMKVKILPLLTLAAALLCGCGSPSQSLTMTVPQADLLQLRTWVPDALKFNVELDPVQGGEKTSSWWGSHVSGMAFQNALEDSLRGVGMLPASSTQPARYQLKTTIVALVQPLVAAHTEVAVSIRYQLIDKTDGKLLYERYLRTAGSADFTDAMLSQPERMRLANEDAVRKNIVAALRDLMAVRY